MQTEFRGPVRRELRRGLCQGKFAAGQYICSGVGLQSARRRRAGQRVQFSAGIRGCGCFCLASAPTCIRFGAQPLARSLLPAPTRWAFLICTRQQLLENFVTLLNLRKLVTIPSCICLSLDPEPVEHADHVLKIMCTCPPSQCLTWASTRAKRDIFSSKSPRRSRAAIRLAPLPTPPAKAVSSWIPPAYRRSAPTLTV
jgi:hypothetical protein